jgi:methylated-DNA-[protein]-cysteine S-methyltransferase
MEMIYYYNSPIGILKILCSDTKLREISFTKEARENPKELSKILLTCKEQLDAYFRKDLVAFDIPIEFTCGTSFQSTVWKALMHIPYAKTTSYKEIATLINNPKAMRAVGGANNKNPIVIVIPCHRVIGNNGKMVGYAGGIDKKIWLLEHEKKEKN